MKTYRFVLSIAILSLLSPLVNLPMSCPASEHHIHKNYKQRLTRSRAKRGYTNNGTVIYNYQEIDGYDDSIEGEEIGNIEVERGSHVREVNNVVIVKGGVKSEKDDLEIGKVTINRSGRAGTVNNSVTINGDLKASGKSVEIGSVHVKHGGKLHSLENTVEIHGGIYAH